MTSVVSRHAIQALKPLAISFAVAAAFSVTASAQTTTSTQDQVARVLVTASRTPVAAKDVLADNVVIGPEEIAQSGFTSIVDLLQQKRGIEISRTGGPGNVSSVFVRGAANAQSIVLVDGVRVGSSTTGAATWEAIPLSQIDHVEIVYGPLSSLYGSSAMGGVIQIFTKKGATGFHPSVSAGVGSYGTRNVEAGVSGGSAIDGERNFHYAISAAHEQADGFSATKPAAGTFSFNPDKDGYDKDSVSGQFSVDLAKGHEIGLTLLQSRLNAQFDAGLGFDDRNVEKIENYSLYSNNQLLPNWHSKLQLAYGIDQTDTDASFGKSMIRTRQRQFGWQNDINLGSDLLQLVAERREEKVDTDDGSVDGKRNTNSVAAAYQLKRDAHLASVSVRSDNSAQFGTHTTGSLAYGYHISSALRVNASYGTSFRAPSFNELYFPGFGVTSNKPEQGRNAEAGIYYEAGASHLSAVYYHNQINDLLVNTATCPVEQATHPFGCAFNVDKALLEGISLGASTRVGSFNLRGALDLQNPRDTTTDKTLARRAKRHGSVALEYAAGALKAGVETVFASTRFDDFANKKPLPGYALLNLYSSYDLAQNWSVFGRWNNALNKDYELAKNYATAGSNLFVGVRYGY
ncbi:TonB-dependent receptor domain-containing protein [Undibacterium arcticum]|uniref:TonB-dependent receptor domain-containing protein n=1 Tax=Undibacterium arcticum TaxID=1762892 RepID=A0ABV7F6L7_9BURK